MTVLDVGCNSGYLGGISDSTNSFYGLDVSKENVAKAKKIYTSAHLYDLNICRPLSWKKTFDVIVFADVLEHIVKSGRVLQFITSRYLKNDGKVILSLPNIANWQIRLSLLFGKFRYTQAGILDETHVHFYTFETAREFAEHNGLIVTDTYSGSSVFGGILQVLPFLRSVLSTGIILVCKKA